MKLYIIGNGFDLNHGFKTSYWDYREFLKEHYARALSDFESFQYIDLHRSNDKWSDLEDSLTIDYDTLMYEAVENYYPNLSDDSDSRWYDLEIDLEQQIEFIYDFTGKFFYEWFLSTDFSSPRHILDFLDTNSLYLTFNYTSTLEDVYKISSENIYHIHGHIKQISPTDIQGTPIFSSIKTIEDAEVDELIKINSFNSDIVRDTIQFGSVKNDPKPIAQDLKSQYQQDDFYEVSLKTGVDSIVGFCNAASKNLERNYPTLKNFLSERPIDEVIVMGHSIMGVDLSYYSDIIIPGLKECLWRFYCHRELDMQNANKFAKKFSLAKICIEKW
ncbi:MAG: bacteriophage abortive infection AbiH family protein [Defluviitaleaceae bacterium]|nr:bacteriophage abortive infection AbiH family protein [Defluviitaleaceae bacterium]